MKKNNANYFTLHVKIHRTITHIYGKFSVDNNQKWNLIYKVAKAIYK